MDGIHFGVHQDQNFYKLDYRFLMKIARHVQSNQKRKLLNFCNILRKIIATPSVFYCDAKYSDTLLGSSHLCCYLFLGGCRQKWVLLLNPTISKFCHSSYMVIITLYNSKIMISRYCFLTPQFQSFGIFRVRNLT